MTDINDTLKTVLQTTGVPVYYEKLDTNKVPGTQYIRFHRISGHEFFNHSGRGMKRDRFQVTCVGRTHALLVALVTLMETALYLNQVSFKLAYPLEGVNEIPDGAETYHKDFYIYYT
jgi:hypothetical protein